MFDAMREIRHRLEKTAEAFLFFDKKSGCYVADGEIMRAGKHRLTVTVQLPQDGHPVHCSSSFFSILFCGGDGTVEIAGHPIHCFAGNILLIREGCQFEVKQEEEAKFILACYDKELFDSLFYSQVADLPIIYDFLLLEGCLNEYLYFDCSIHMEISHFAYALLLSLSEGSYDEKTIRCSTVLFLSKLHRVHQANLVISESSMMKKYLIGNILKYMADNCSTVTLNTVAAHFNYHPAYFSAMFKRLAKATFSKKLMEIRMERVRRMLDYTHLPVKEIWQSAGFEEHSYFHRSFKLIYGITPHQYRKKIQQREGTH